MEHNIFAVPTKIIDLDEDVAKKIKDFYAEKWSSLEYRDDCGVASTWAEKDGCEMCPDLLPAIKLGLMDYFEKVSSAVDIEGAVIADYWLQDYKDGGEHMPHHHPMSVVSGVYYVESNNEGSPLVFYNPNSAQHFANYSTFTNIVEPWEGRLVLFPSWLVHGVPKNRGDNVVRRVLAFNVEYKHGT